MPENLEITKKLRERFKNCELLEYVGDWKGRPVYRVSDIPLIDYFTSYQGGPDFVWVDPENIGKSFIFSKLRTDKIAKKPHKHRLLCAFKHRPIW